MKIQFLVQPPLPLSKLKYRLSFNSMLTQRSFKLAVIFLLAMAAAFLYCSSSNSQIVDARTQQAQSPVREERFTTRLLDLFGNEVARYQGRFDQFSRDGQQIITTSIANFGQAYLFDQSGSELFRFKRNSAQFSPDGQRLIVISDGKTYVYDLTGREIAQLPANQFQLPIFSSDGQRIIALAEDSVSVLDLSNEQTAQVPGYFIDLGGGFDTTGQRFILYQLDEATSEASCHLFNSTGQSIRRLPEECSGISPDEQIFTVAVGTFDNVSTQIYDFSGRAIAQLAGGFPVFSPDGQLILTTQLYQADSSYLYDSSGREIAQLQGTGGRVSSNGQRILTVLNGIIHLYASSGNELAQVRGDRAAFLPNSEKFVSFVAGNNENPLDISGGETRLFDSFGRELASLTRGSSPNNQLWLAGAGVLQQPNEMSNSFNSLFSQDGQRLAISDSGKTYVYASSGEQIAELQGSFRGFSSTSQHLVTVSDSTIYLFDRFGNQIFQTEGEFGGFSPDGQSLVVVQEQ